MLFIKSWIVSQIKKSYRKRIAPTPDELKEKKEIEKIAHEVCNTLHTSSALLHLRK